MTTETMLAKMLTENTGKHFLDSGMENGRAWQRNQGRDFKAEPQSTVEFRVYNGKLEINVTHNVYHWLAERLNYDEKLDAKFQRWANLPANKEEGWLGLMNGWVTRLREKYGEERVRFGFYWGEASEDEPRTINTYNGEDLLSQTLQFTPFWFDEELYVLLQIHGGADVRGGYTRPRVFSAGSRHDETAIYDNARGSIGCSECDSNWSTDDGCNWYEGGACGSGYVNLEDREAIEFEPENLVVCAKDSEPHEKHTHGNDDALCNFAEEITLKDFAGKHNGKVVVHDRKALCPDCGVGTLTAGFY